MAMSENEIAREIVRQTSVAVYSSEHAPMVGCPGNGGNL